jgi:hypothetical protein
MVIYRCRLSVQRSAPPSHVLYKKTAISPMLSADRNSDGSDSDGQGLSGKRRLSEMQSPLSAQAPPPSPFARTGVKVKHF